jgi:hypothetical protein
MITTGILYVLLAFITVLLSPFRLMPDVSLPASITAAITSADASISSMYAIAPFTTTALLVAIGLVIIVEEFILAWKIAMWLIKKLPGIN